MHLAAQTFVGQLVTASLYALVGVGFVIVYRSTRVLNFAQGLMALIGGYVCYSIFNGAGMGFWPSVLLSLVVAAALGAAIYAIVLRPLIGQSPLLLVMLTIALSTVLGAIALIAWGANTDFLPNPYSANVTLPGNLHLTEFDLGTIVVTFVLISAFALLLRRSQFGAAMRASAELPVLASHRGIRVGLIAASTWAIAMVGASLAGIAYGATNGLSPDAGELLGFAAFPAIVLGGIDSVAGALVGAVVLAEVQGYAITYLGGQYGDVVGYVILLIVLVIRPTGLFGSREVARL